MGIPDHLVDLDRLAKEIYREEANDPDFWREMHHQLNADQDEGRLINLFRAVRRLCWLEKERCEKPLLVGDPVYAEAEKRVEEDQ